MAQEWYIDYGDRVEGPVSSRDLQTRAVSGTLRPTDRVSPDRDKWVPAAKIKGLTFADLPAKPAPRSARTVGAGQSSASSAGPLETIVHEDADAGIPGYEILGVLGSGGMGVVYKAKQLKLDRLVALKTIPVSLASARMAARFEKEAVALAKLQHPNIVNVFDFGRAGERVYFAMEILAGRDLAQQIEAAGAVDERTAWTIARQTAAALAHAADQGIFHRDIKPHNLFLVPMPTGFGYPPDLPMVKVTDFGLALTKRAEEVADERLTAAGTVLGTPAYMAPEQFKTTDVDHRADIYSLGATVYHALAGRPPFGGTTVWDVMVSKIAGDYPPLGPPVTQETNELIAAMIAPEIADRVPDYADLIRRIDDLPVMRGVAGTAAKAAPPVPAAETPADRAARKAAKRQRRTLVVGSAVAVVAVAGLAVGGWAVLGRGSPPAPPTSPAPPPEVVFVPAKNGEIALFDPVSVVAWGNAELDKDDETLPVLLLQKGVRKVKPFDHFEVLLGLDLFGAKSAEVVFAVPAAAPAVGQRLAVRVTRDGAVFGTLQGGTDEFEPLGPAVPFPTADELKTGRPYQEVKFRRAGGRWSAAFRGRPLGSVADDGKPKLDEFRITASGGKVRVESAVLQELTAEPPKP